MHMLAPLPALGQGRTTLFSSSPLLRERATRVSTPALPAASSQLSATAVSGDHPSIPPMHAQLGTYEGLCIHHGHRCGFGENLYVHAAAGPQCGRPCLPSLAGLRRRRRCQQSQQRCSALPPAAQTAFSELAVGRHAQTVADLSEGLETPVQLIYLLTLLGFLVVGAYLVVRQVGGSPILHRALELGCRILILSSATSLYLYYMLF